jgi:hypothetical protein
LGAAPATQDLGGAGISVGQLALGTIMFGAWDTGRVGSCAFIDIPI